MHFLNIVTALEKFGVPKVVNSSLYYDEVLSGYPPGQMVER
jgi:hypothetical protein